MIKWVMALFLLSLAGCASAPQFPGEFATVRGHRMHFYCSGPERLGPTVVVEAGHRSPGQFYARLQNALEKQVRVCTYDRAGLGLSDANDTPRDAKQMARDLHDLLVSAKIPPPYVLAGHSIGGMIAVRYVHDYPGDVVGVALLDATHPENYTLYRNSPEGTAAAIKSTKRLRWLTWLGLNRIYTPAGIKNTFEPLPDDAREQMLYLARKPSIGTKMLNTTVGELEGMEDSFALLVVTANKHYTGGSNATEEERAWWVRQGDGWRNLHAQYALLSSRARHVVIDEATHETLFTDAQNAARVAKETLVLVNEAQGVR
jgi:pimeloyl-ACP methyl ester carboxylesterase